MKVIPAFVKPATDNVPRQSDLYLAVSTKRSEQNADPAEPALDFEAGHTPHPIPL
jgi:hypothetical protein